MGKRIFIYVFWLLLFCMMSGQVIGQNKSVESHSHTCKTVLALKNNLLYDLALAPNIEVELPLGKRWSLNVEYKCPWWSDSGCNFCYQLLSGGTEARYWWETAIRAEDCPDTSWEHMPKEVPMIFS